MPDCPHARAKREAWMDTLRTEDGDELCILCAEREINTLRAKIEQMKCAGDALLPWMRALPTGILFMVAAQEKWREVSGD